MKMTLPLAVAGVVALCGGAAQATTYTFGFSFLDALTGNQVEGTIYGLREHTHTTVVDATRIEVTLNSGGYGLGTYTAGGIENLWIVSGGQVAAADFRSHGPDGTGADAGCCSLMFWTTSHDGIYAGLSDDGDYHISPASKVTFTQLSATPVPLPAAGLALPAAIGALAITRARRRKARAA
ncbi:hypothetical protein [Mangrovicoccus ximenensis]|uniref:hypothetical protein n=1 Tax=Mangrovicoccus ximenensis TaxID=1911570 RepID=UPI000D3B539D|nr:hypothetical protein [Mangrovicoccus ximenensis]